MTTGNLPNPQYRCYQCKHEWEGELGPPNFCPECGHDYCDWLKWKMFEHISHDAREAERKKRP